MSFPLRNALLGYHASPQALVDGFNNAVEESDRDALSDLFWTDEEDPFQAYLSGTMSALSGYCQPLIYVSQDHDWGNPYAVITVYYGELTDSSDRDPYVNSKEEITAERYSSAYLFTVAAIKRDGQWYFSAGDYTTLMRSSFTNSKSCRKQQARDSPVPAVFRFLFRLYRFRTLELGIVQVGVKTARCQQFVVSTLFDDIAVLHYQNQVGIPNRGQPMGDDKAGAALHQIVHGLLNEQLRTRIHRAGGFIQNQDGRIRQNRPGNGQQLFLSLRNIAGFLVDFMSYPPGSVSMKW